LSVVPHKSLVQNIGFGADATHTFEQIAFATQQSSELAFPLRHPPFVLRDAVADNRYHATRLRTDWRKKIKKRLRRFGFGIR
nr:nucleotide-diphospho-sugar transferase [Cytophagales bacterium]